MIFRYSRLQISISIQIPRVFKIADIKGIAAYHVNSYVPLKKPQQGELTSLQREYNRALSQERMGIEHINRSLKIFRILSERYRNRRRRYSLRCNLISAIYNHELTMAA